MKKMLCLFFLILLCSGCAYDNATIPTLPNERAPHETVAVFPNIESEAPPIVSAPVHDMLSERLSSYLLGLEEPYSIIFDAIVRDN